MPPVAPKVIHQASGQHRRYLGGQDTPEAFGHGDGRGANILDEWDPVATNAAFDEMRSVLDGITADEPEMVFPALDPQSLENEMEAEPEPTTLTDFISEEG